MQRRNRWKKLQSKIALLMVIALAMQYCIIPSNFLSEVYAAKSEQVVQSEEKVTDETKSEEKKDAEEVKEEEKTEEAEQSDKQVEEKAEESSASTTEFKSEDENVTVRAEVSENAFKEDVTLVVKPLKAKSDEYKDAAEKLKKEKVKYDGMMAYDVHFENGEGEEVEPEGAVKVEMEVKKGTLIGKDADKVDTDAIQITHIHGKKVENVADSTKKTEGDVKVVEKKGSINKVKTDFEVENFSTITITWKNAQDEDQSCTIHYVTPNGSGGYDELTEPVLVDTSEATGSISLNNNFDGYSCYGAIYKESENATDSSNIDLQLFKTESGWAMDKLVSDGEHVRKERVPIANGSHIYVSYGEHQEHGSSQGHPEVKGPTTVKTVTRNEDGTSTIRLDITAPVVHTEDREGANVIVILDTTRSMSYYMDRDTNETAPRNQMRMEAARSALNVLVNSLDMNTNDINFALAEFNLTGSTHTWGQGDWTNNPETILGYVNGRTGPGNQGYQLDYTTSTSGTNWEIGLRQGQGLLTQAETDPNLKKNKTYVIFVTDGDPNRWEGYPSYWNNQYNHYTEAVEHAQDEANNIAGRSQFYGVFCGASSGADRLETLITTAGGVDNINARSRDEIESAFEGIAHTIISDLGSSAVVVDDGVTQLSSISAQVHGNAGGFRYEKNGQKWDGAPAASFSDDNGVTWDLSSVGTLENNTTYSVEFDVWPSQEAYDAIANLDNGAVEIKDLTVDQKEQFVVDVPGNGTYEYEKGKGWTKDGTNYISDNQLQALITPQTQYSIKTNTHLNTTYTYSGQTYTDTSDKGHNTMELKAEEMNVRKAFADNMNPAQTHEAVRFYLLRDGKYYQNNGTTSTSKENAFTMDLPTTGGDWFDKIYIAPGYMTEETVDGESVIEVLEPGHDYSLEEEVLSGKDYEYEFTPQTVRPMVINRTLTYLTLKDKYNTNPDGAKEYEIDGKTYYVSGTSEGELVGTNRKTGELDITKLIDGSLSDKSQDQLNNESFTYRVKLSIPDGGDPTGIVGYEYVVRDTSNAYYLYGYHDYGSEQDIPVTGLDTDVSRFGDLKYRAWNTLLWQWFVETEQSGSSTVVKRDENGNFIWKVPADADGYHTVTVDMTLKQLEVIRFTNLPLGTKYEIQEIYANEYPADNTGGQTSGREPVSKASTINEQGYTISQVRSTNGEVSNTEIANDTVSGVIEDPNVRYYNQFTNKLSATDAELKVKKITNNYELADDDSLTFTLAAGEATYADGTTGTSPMPEKSTVTIKGTTADLTNTFGSVRYTKAGTYKYTVTEENAGQTVDGVTHGAAKEIEVKVELKNGVLTVTDISATSPATGTFDDDTNTFTVDYDNTYNATGSLELDGKKILENKTIEAGKFSFKITGTDGTSETVTNDANGKFEFSKIEYSLEDIKNSPITYTVEEVGGGTTSGGIAITDKKYTINVTLADDGKGHITVTTDPATINLEFTNTYSATGDATLEVTKALTGRKLNEGEFSFELKEGNELLQTKTNAANGKVEFDKIDYTLADVGTHTYTITEINGGSESISYDDMTVTVTVKVTDNGDGTLKTEVTYPDDTEFNNTYTATGSLDLSVNKELEGRKLEEGQFTFQLLDADDNDKVLQTKTNAANGTVTFDTINYNQDQVGPHHYTIKEVPGTAQGYTYSTNEVSVTVEVEDDGKGHLTATPTYSGELKFVNTYEAEGELELKAVKKLEGKTLEAGEFKFQLIDAATGEVLQTKENDADGKVTFDKIKFDQDDIGTTPKYKIVEVNEEKTYFIYDTSEYEVTVTLKDNGDGTITATPDKNDAQIEFNNKYHSSGKVELEAKKVLNGSNLKEGQFTFELMDKDGKVLQTKTNDADGKVAFDEIKYTEADISKSPITYTIHEVNAGQNGYTYADDQTITVTLTDDGKGTITATPDKNGAEVEFVNTYEAKGETQLTAKKVLKGRTLEADQFTFQLKDANGTVIDTQTNKADGTVTFKKLSYTEADLKNSPITYTISEVNDGNPGYEYDTTPQTVIVTLTDNGDGTITATPDKTGAQVTFNNTYTAEGKAKIEAIKKLTGRDLEAEQFSFVLTDADGKEIETVKNDADGKVTFSEISYDQGDAGKTFNYTITEKNDGAAGYTYASDPVNVTVKVEDKGDGTLETTVTYDPEDKTFINTYEAKGETQLTALKVLNGRKLEEGQFTFQLKDADGNVIDTQINKADGTVTFKKLSYTEADIKNSPITYTISEVNDGNLGYEYDTTPQTVKVTLTDNGDGTITATPDKTGAQVTFTNTYTAEGKAKIEAIKKLTGRDLEAEQFSFVLTDADGKEIETVKNAADGKVTFSEISYDQDDAGKTFNYTITEKNDGAAGYTYASDPVNVTVKVTDKGDGTLGTEVTYDPEDKTFINTYKAEGETVLTAKKVLTGRTLKEGQFTFQLKDADGNVIDTKTNDADGNVTFDTLKYDQTDVNPSSHTAEVKYTIVEVDGGKPGYTYDTNPQDVTVTLTDNGDGTITATPDKDDYSVTFNNTYAAEGSAKINLLKELNGRKLADGQFLFTITGDDVTGVESTSVTNDAEGNIQFNIKYDQDDAGKTFKYKITEENAGAAGYTYADNEIEVSVEVTDNGDGTLKTVVTYPENKKFINTYEAEGEINFNVNKVLTGRTLEDGQFEFQLLDKDGKVLQTKTNNENGAVVFDAIKYTEKDADKEFTYTVKEVKGDNEAIDYDSHEVVYTVKVTDNGDSTMKAEETHTGSLEFNNDYTAKGSTVLTAKKELKGRTVAAGQFTFQLKDADGNVIDEKTNDAEGKVTFDTLNYTQKDVDPSTHEGEAVYSISEVNEGDSGYTYASNSEDVKVSLKDDGKGKITATPDKDDYSITFENTYQAEGEVQLTAKKLLKGRKVEAGQFKFILKDAQGKQIGGEVTNDANGEVTFDAITYTEKDVNPSTHKATVEYTISEVKESAAGYTYAENIETVKVDLVDNGDGTITATPDKDGAEVSFTNVYKAEGKVTLEALKTLEGRKIEKGQFKFELKDSKGGVIDTKTNDEDGKVTFDAIKYTEKDVDEAKHEGEYTYTISEVKGSKGGYTYDEDVETVTVSLKDNGDGTITATPDKTGAEVKFDNTYEAKGSIKLKAKKELDGRKLKEGQFKFILIGPDGEQIGEEVANDADGNIVFPKVTFDQTDVDEATHEGKYTYTVKEVAGEEDCYEYDTKAQKITVSLSDNGDGTITATPDRNAKDVVFKNKYNAKGSAAIELNKKLKGEKLSAGQFKFTIAGDDLDGVEKTTVKNDADGKINFNITYDQYDAGKTFTYKVTEVNSGKANITYDKKEIVVKVKVTDNGDGTLSTEVTYPGAKTFVNTYNPPPVPPTGDATRLAYLLVLITGSTLALVGTYRKRKRA